MNAPAIFIRLALEAPPLVYPDYANDSEERRLADWLDSHPRYLELVERAVELAQEARAA